MSTTEQRASSPLSRAAAHGCDVFVIEDDDLSLDAIERAIASFGYSVGGATSGEDALLAFAREGEIPRLILLDLVMPGMSGETFLGELRRHPRLAPIPVVLMSGRPDVASQAERLNAAGYLKKPSSLGELQRVAARFVAQA